MKRKYFILGAVIFVIDQLSKILIDTFVGDTDIVVIKNFFSITKVNNTGAAFSILENKTWLLIIISAIVLLLVLKMSREFKANRWNIGAFGLLLGGILGNLSDRLFLGSVRDFLKFRIFGYNYPVFNLADVAIVIGVFLLIISIFKGEDKSESSSRDRRKRETR